MKKIITISLTVLMSSALIIGGTYAVKRVTTPALSPEQTVRSFYSSWIEYQGEGNPISDRIYRESDLASAAFTQKLDAIIDSFEFGGYDPVLCAQDIPQNFEITMTSQDEKEALARVAQDFYGLPKFVMVELSKQSGRWQIDNIACQEGETARGARDNNPSIPVQNLVGDYLRENLSELAPEKEVLGGTFRLNRIVFTGPNSAVMEYDDGHNLYRAEIDFGLPAPGGVKIDRFEIISEN